MIEKLPNQYSFEDLHNKINEVIEELNEIKKIIEPINESSK